MNAILIDTLLGLGLAILIALAAWRAHALSPQGAVAACLLGTVIFGLGGLGWAFPLLGFFISSSLLSRLFRRRKQALDEKFSKGSRRDAGQVLANGGIAGVFVLLHLAFPGQLWPWAGFAGALAAANADTWATELGVLNRSAPRLITNGKIVERGTSGGVSPLGFLSAAAGAFVIALLGVLFWQGRVAAAAGAPEWLGRILGSGVETLSLPRALLWLVVITLAGVVGSAVDSLLGATVQAIYYCPACEKETERHPIHTCGTETSQVRGWAWMDNDVVNLICTLAGVVVAMVVAVIA
jgi:uncharacterized protein (TIGR00297 family)